MLDRLREVLISSWLISGNTAEIQEFLLQGGIPVLPEAIRIPLLGREVLPGGTINSSVASLGAFVMVSPCLTLLDPRGSSRLPAAFSFKRRCLGTGLLPWTPQPVMVGGSSASEDYPWVMLRRQSAPGSFPLELLCSCYGRRGRYWLDRTILLQLLELERLRKGVASGGAIAS